ncbi:hypothetical protein F5X99DRAFT_404372 [Biscogniauxia marginata]|nr:hypothetical protein F5X99DRAFT_404372 [Biscogniauxia marginata]
MKFALSVAVQLLVVQIAAGAAIPGAHGDITIETIIHHEEPQHFLNHDAADNAWDTDILASLANAAPGFTVSPSS